MSLGALRSTPINNMLFETNITPIYAQKEILTTKLFKNLLYGTNTPIKQIFKKVKVSKKVPKIPSTVLRTVINCKKLNIPLDISDVNHRAKSHPSWSFDNRSIDTTIHQLDKSNSNPSEFRKMFAMIKETLNEYQFIYTDGSKSDNHTTFSITTENRIIKMSVLPLHSSIYTAEIIAILEAILCIKGKVGKFAICTDSLSSLKSISNIDNNSYYVTKIRNILTNTFPNIILVWVPGHSQIKGNEFADLAAKEAATHPLHLTQNYNRSDIDKFINNFYITQNRNHLFSLSSNWYKRINISQTSAGTLANNQEKINRLDQIKIERIRLGHTRLTHGSLFSNNFSPFCNCDIQYPTKPSHFLCECPQTQTFRTKFFQNSDPINLLSNPSPDNIIIIIKFLKNSKLYNEI